MAQLLSNFVSKKGLSLKNVIRQLNDWCGFPFWDETSTLTTNQQEIFNSINWSKLDITINELPTSMKGAQIIKIKIPKECQIIPTSENIIDILFSQEFLGYPEVQSISSRIAAVISEQNPLIKQHSMYAKLQNFTSKAWRESKYYVLKKMLTCDTVEEQYNEKEIFQQFLTYCLEQKILKQETFNKFLLLLPSLKIPIQYRSKSTFSIKEFCASFRNSEYRKSRFLFNQIQYFYKIKLDDSFFEAFSFFLVSYNISEGSLTDFFSYLIEYIEQIQPISYLKYNKKPNKFYEPNKACSIYSISVPMGNK